MVKKITVNDLSIQRYIEDIAAALEEEVLIENNTYRIQIPEKYGSGYIVGTHFDNGVGVIDHDFLLKKELVIYVENSTFHKLKLVFNREETFYHKFTEDNEFAEIRHLENVMISSKPDNTHVFRLPRGNPVCYFQIDINRREFENKVNSFLDDMNGTLRNLLRDVNGVNIFRHQAYYSLEIAKLITEFTECELDSFMKAVYQEGKTFEIISQQFKQFIDDHKNPDRRKILRQVTIKSIEDAVEIIQDEIGSMESIPSLAKRVGLNQNTLQNGFKHLYKTSVNEYIRNYRIEKAKDLLENSALNITEITYKIGINSRSYFSKLFKEKYGISPKRYLEQNRGKPDTDKSA
ncbi:helix-turn-helix domain-containing protein [Flavobacteriaceae bacterium M23B6Z8]